jgi:hypothetical protein
MIQLSNSNAYHAQLKRPASQKMRHFRTTKPLMTTAQSAKDADPLKAFYQTKSLLRSKMSSLDVSNLVLTAIDKKTYRLQSYPHDRDRGSPVNAPAGVASQPAAIRQFQGVKPAMCSVGRTSMMEKKARTLRLRIKESLAVRN